MTHKVSCRPIVIILKSGHLCRKEDQDVEQITKSEIECENVIACPHPFASNHGYTDHSVANYSNNKNDDKYQTKSPSHWRRLDEVATFGRWDRASVILVHHTDGYSACRLKNSVSLHLLQFMLLWSRSCRLRPAEMTREIIAVIWRVVFLWSCKVLLSGMSLLC